MMLFLAYILNIFIIFEVQTHYSINEKYFKNFKELKDRRGNESVPSTTDFSSTDVFCNDLSAIAQNSKTCFMQNTSESLLAQNNTINVLRVNISENLDTMSGFTNRYFSYLSTSRSLNDAFIKASVDYFNSFQTFKFSSFNQFKTARYGSVN